MSCCKQTETQSVLQHGISVRRYYDELLTFLVTGKELDPSRWRAPDWLEPNRELLLSKLLPDEILGEYQVYHDCGKPYCLTIDDDGRRHFPDHAKMSGKIWRQIGGNEQAARLMEMDMDVHLLKADGVEEFASRPEAISLLLTGLAELHSNAQMFGGIESTSFKIKWKHLNKRGKQILKSL